MQLVFQDPYASLNPRMTVLELVAEPLVVHGLAKNPTRPRDRRCVDLLDRCGLPVDTVDRYPHAFSGGQRQRVGIARALALHPDFIVADEPVSALDVSVRAQVVNLLQDLQHELGLTYLFIAHDLSVVRHISHRIAILYCRQAGRAGAAPTRHLRVARCTRTPRRCCRACRSPIRRCNGPAQRIVLHGEIPNPVNPPSGCRFQTRCPLVEPRCRVESAPARGEGARPLGRLLRALMIQDPVPRSVEPDAAATPADSSAPGFVKAALVGLAAGFLSGLFGVGGGILLVPALVIVLKLGQKLAHGTSLAAVLPIAMSSLLGYTIEGKVDWPVAGSARAGRHRWGGHRHAHPAPRCHNGPSGGRSRRC